MEQMVSAKWLPLPLRRHFPERRSSPQARLERPDKTRPGEPDQGWDYNPADSQDEVLAGLVQKRLNACVKTVRS
ncbi:MAG: hypothetical protein Q8O37_02170 [Sulfuricellaceae bacterium]|nr:hypothetical protein [Sulfuricellaceae bacterium]